MGRTSQVHLDSVSTEERGQLHVQWDFVTSVFPDGMIEEMFASYVRVLKTLASDPEAWERQSFDTLIRNSAPDREIVAGGGTASREIPVLQH
jgi:hypothetical protein